MLPCLSHPSPCSQLGTDHSVACAEPEEQTMVKQELLFTFPVLQIPQLLDCKTTFFFDFSLIKNAPQFRIGVIHKRSILKVLFMGRVCEAYSTARGQCGHILLVFYIALVDKIFVVFPEIYSYSV
jgi:hypothetical protein